VDTFELADSREAEFEFMVAANNERVNAQKNPPILSSWATRIAFAPDFAAYAKAGEKLAGLHTGYETQKKFKLKRVEAGGVKADWRVERMKLSKDKTSLVYNDWLTLEGLPAAAFAYRLGNRSSSTGLSTNIRTSGPRIIRTTS